jgi:hypothetical protein
VPKKSYPEVEKAVKDTITKANLVDYPPWVLKIV